MFLILDSNILFIPFLMGCMVFQKYFDSFVFIEDFVEEIGQSKYLGMSAQGKNCEASRDSRC
jgi:hypothetical protein